MAGRLDYSRDRMVARTTGFASVTDPKDGETIQSFSAGSDGVVLGVALTWSGAAPAAFRLVAGNADPYPVAVGAGGAVNLEIIGRVSYSGSAADVPPSVFYNPATGRYSATCCALSWSGRDYNEHPAEEAEGGFSLYLGDVEIENDLTLVGSPGANRYQEPQELFAVTNLGIDGGADIDAILARNPGPVYMTVLCAADRTEEILPYIPEGVTVDLVVKSVFTSRGAGRDYEFNPAALAAAGVALWGGDGAGGMRGAETVRLVADGAHTGTAAAAIIYARS